MYVPVCFPPLPFLLRPSLLHRLLKLSCFCTVVSLRHFSFSLPFASMLQAIRTRVRVQASGRLAFPMFGPGQSSDELPRKLSGFGSLAQPNDNRSDPRTPEGGADEARSALGTLFSAPPPAEASPRSSVLTNQPSLLLVTAPEPS